MMGLLPLRFVWITVILCMFVNIAFSQEGEPKTVSEILRTLKNNMNWSKSVSFHIETHSYNTLTGDKREINSLVRRDDNAMRFQQFAKITAPGAHWLAPGSAISEQYIYGMLGNKSSFFAYRLAGEENTPGRIRVFRNGKERVAFKSTYDSAGGPMFLSLSSISSEKSLCDLLSSADVALSNEVLEGKACAVVAGETPFGNIKMWLSAEEGYAPLKYEVKKVPGKHLSSDGKTMFSPAPLKEDGDFFPTTHTLFTVDNIVLEKIGTYYVPVKGELLVRPEFEKGKDGGEQRTVIELSNIELEPDFEAMGAFKLEGVPDGTNVQIFEEDNRVSTDFVYRDGQVVPRINQKALAAIEDTVRVAKGQAALETGKHTTLHLEVREKSAQVLGLEKGVFFEGKIILLILFLGALIILVSGIHFFLRKRKKMTE